VVLDEGNDDISFGAFFGWYSAISTLAQDDVTKIDKVTEIPLVLALNHLSYMKALNEEKEQQLKKQTKR